MSCVSDIQQARSPQEGLLALAKHIDALHAKLDAKAATPHDGWGEWSQPPAKIDHRVVANAEAATKAIKRRLAEATDPDDIRALTAQLALAEDTGQSLADVVPEGRREQVTVTDSEILIESPAPTPERAFARRQWCQGKDIHTFFPMWKDDPEGFVDTFVKGGPLWMYHGDRDAIMQMPFEWRRDLVHDIEADSPATSQEVGRDILKSTTEQQRDFVESLDA